MLQERTCPHCRTPVAPGMDQCPSCRTVLPGAAPRYHVVRANRGPGQGAGPGAGAAAGPASPGQPSLPPGVAAIDESARVWYCKIGGQTVGPVQAADIRAAFAKGRINGEASVGIQGHDAWYPIRSLPQFADLVTGVQPIPLVRKRSQGAAGPAPARPPAGAAAAAPAPAAAAAPAPAAAGVHAAAPAVPGPVPPSAAQSGPAQAVGVPSAASADRDDETLVVPPLPPPSWLAVGDATGQVTDPRLRALSDEVRRLRKLVITLAVLSGLLFVLSGILVALLAGGD